MKPRFKNRVRSVSFGKKPLKKIEAEVQKQLDQFQEDGFEWRTEGSCSPVTSRK